MGLRASLEIEPSSCDNCGLLLSNTWLGDVIAPIIFVLLVIATEMRFDTVLFDTNSAFSMLGLLLAVLAVRFVFTSPRPYPGRKAWCPRCAKTDAIHDWTNDPTCMACESKLRPGMRISDIDSE